MQSGHGRDGHATVMVLRTLAISNFKTHRVRLALTVAAVALSVSLVVSVTSGYASIEATALRFMNRFMGATDAQIYRRNEAVGGVSQELIAQLRADPDVKHVTERLEVRHGMIDELGRTSNRSAEVVGIQRPGDKQVESLEIVQGRWFNAGEPNAVVIDDAAARLLKNRDQAGDYLDPKE